MISGILTIAAHRQLGSLATSEHVSLIHRMALAVISYCRYLGKTILPLNLSVFYPHLNSFDLWQAIGGAILLLAISFFVIWIGKRSGSLVVGWFWFLVTLLPVIGLLQVGLQSIADRFMYVPLIGLLIVAVFGMREASVRFKFLNAILAPLVVALLVSYWIGSSIQLRHWRNSVTLFTHVVAVTPASALAHYNLGAALGPAGRIEEAIPHLKAAILIDPMYRDAYFNLGVAYESLGNLEKAAECYRTLINIAPSDVATHCALSTVLLRLGDIEPARLSSAEAVRLDPQSAEARYCMGTSCLCKGDLEKPPLVFRLPSLCNPSSPKLVRT